MTTEHEASRTLVKSPPELWAECSDPGSLARHLGEFGEITITRLEPESAVAWEGEHASGTVRIEPSGWGTRVTLTAQPKVDPPETPPEIEAREEPEPAPSDAETNPDEEEIHAEVEETVEDPDPVPVADTGRARARWRRITARFRRRQAEPSAVNEASSEPPPESSESIPPPERQPEATTEPEPTTEPESEPEPEATTEPEPESTPEADLDPESILAAALDSLGQAHHRPFSRA